MNSHRQLVQYGDLEQSQQTNGASSSAVAFESRSRQSPPSKKRKRSNQKAKRPRKTAHWDEPGDNQMNYDDASAHGEDGEVEEGESRELTHQEIWDDSALIDAWNSATAEYEAFHGETQDWKSTAVKKSSLWYNIPYNSSKEKAKTPNLMKAASAEAISQAATAEGEDSAPLDFDTFVPSYDPSLPVPSEAPAAPESSFFIPAPSTTMYTIAKISSPLRRLSRSKIIRNTKMMKKLLRTTLKIWYLLSGNCQAVTGKVQNWYAKELKAVAY